MPQFRKQKNLRVTKLQVYTFAPYYHIISTLPPPKTVTELHSPIFLPVNQHLPLLPSRTCIPTLTSRRTTIAHIQETSYLCTRDEETQAVLFIHNPTEVRAQKNGRGLPCHRNNIER